MINIFQPSLGSAELAAVERVFKSNWIGRGKETTYFEQEFASHLHAKEQNVTSVVNCTEGLFHICQMLPIGPGDEVIMPSISFVGAANAVAATGAKVVFCDVDPRTLNARVADIEAAITPQSRAIMIIHYGGIPGEMDKIAEMSRRRGLYLIEDCACSVASRFKGQACGTFGDASAWSFDAMKILVCGDGGMIWLRESQAIPSLKRSIYLGLNTESGFTSASDSRWWEFEISNFGRRATINDITAAIGRVQLSRLQSFVSSRKEIWELYQNLLGEISWLKTPPPISSDVESSYYLYWIQCESERRDRLATYLKENRIYTTFRYYPLNRVKEYEFNKPLPFTDLAADTTLNLPIHQSMSIDDVKRIVDVIKTF